VDIVPLAELLVLKDAGVWGDEDEVHGTIVLRSTNVKNDGSIDFRKQARRAIPAKKVAEKSLQEGDILLERSGGSPAQPVGRVAYFRGYEQTVVHGNFIGRLRPNPDLVEPRYLFRFLHRLHQTGGTLRYQAQTTGLRNLKFKEYERLDIPLPPRDEQRRIAHLLDEADRLQRLRKEANEKAQRILPALFVEMFGDPETNPMGWEIKPLKEVATIQIGPFGSLLHQKDYVEGGIPLINPKHIQGGRIAPSASNAITPEKHHALKKYQLRAGDVVMGRRGEMGRCAVVGADEDGWLCGTGSLIIRPLQDRASAPYLASLLSHNVMRRRLESLSLGLTLPNLNATIVQNLLVMLPPNDRQVAFKDALTRTKGVIANQAVAERGLGDAVATLRSHLFAGAV